MMPLTLEAGLMAPFSVSVMPMSESGMMRSMMKITLWSGSDGYPAAGRMP